MGVPPLVTERKITLMKKIPGTVTFLVTIHYYGLTYLMYNVYNLKVNKN